MTSWANYLLLHSGISENDNRRSALYRNVTNLCDCDTGEYDFDLLQIAAVAYLKQLDELHDDRGARLAADQALVFRITQCITLTWLWVTPEQKDRTAWQTSLLT